MPTSTRARVAKGAKRGAAAGAARGAVRGAVKAARRPARRPARRRPARRYSLPTPRLPRISPDGWGIAAIVAGVIGALGTYADLTGPIGRVLRVGAGAAVG